MSSESPNRGESELDARLGRAWREHRRYVLDVALRMVGDLGEAEDVVQEAFTRLLRADVDEIDDVRAWLVTVVSRLCLDQLRSARRRRQEPFDGPPGAPAPSDRLPSTAAVDPADRVTLDDSVRMALQVMLERLSPAERTALVLHDVFRLSFNDIAGIVGRSPAACRQLAHRARAHLHDETNPARFTVESAEQRQVTETFITAAATGDLDALLAVLDPDVAGQADLGGSIGLLPPIVGRDQVAGGVLRFYGPGGKYGPDADVTLLSLPTGRRPSILALRDGEAAAVITLTVRDGLVEHIHTIVDPAKLAPLTVALRSSSL